MPFMDPAIHNVEKVFAYVTVSGQGKIVCLAIEFNDSSHVDIFFGPPNAAEPKHVGLAKRLADAINAAAKEMPETG